MNLLNITIENFGSIGHINLDLNKPGLILITGLNKDAPNADSNGSGKSLLFEAICWCVWGETVRGLSGDEVVNTRVGQDCCVSLTLEEHGTRYVITRHRLDSRNKKPNDLTVRMNGEFLGTTGKMKSMQEVVNQIIGFEFETFRAMMPGAGIKVASMTDKAIKELLESLLQTEQLSQAYEAARVNSKALEQQVATKRSIIASCNSQISLTKSHLTDVLNTKQTIEAETQRRKEGHIAEIKLLSDELARVDQELQAEAEVLQSHTNIKNSITQLDNYVMANILEPMRAALAVKDAEIRQLEHQLTGLSTQIKVIKANVSKANNLGPSCTACFQTVPEEHVAKVLEEANNSLARLEEERVQCETQVTLANAARKVIETSANEQLSIKKHELLQLKSAEKLLQENIVTISHTKKLRDRIKADLAREEAALKNVDLTKPDFDALIKQHTDREADLTQQVAVLKAEIDSLEEEIKLCSFWVNGFSPAGLRSFMLDYVTPILNDRAKYYSKLLTNDELTVSFSTKSTLKNGQEKDKFTILCQHNHGSDTYRGSSAGERARADLVVAMALGDLAQFRTAKQLPWRFLDEPFEAVDRSGTEAIVRLLNDQKSRYRTVFVVTHKPEFKEMFTQSITVVKENGLSTLVSE